MANFINYRNLDFKLNGQNFYATQLSLSAQASVEAILLSDGSLLNYAPQNSVVGSLSCEFYLTGSVPSFLNVLDDSELPVTGTFAGVNITGNYIKSLSFSVEPFQPILLSVEFDWYGSVDVSNFEEQSVFSRSSKASPQYIASAYKSYMNTQDIFLSSSGSSGVAGSSDKIGNILSFDYNVSCDRPSFYNAGDIFPFRVAKLNKRCKVNLKSNDLGKLISINGKIANTNIYLKDFYGQSLDYFSISGILTSQGYEVNEGQYLLASASIDQTFSSIKNII